MIRTRQKMSEMKAQAAKDERLRILWLINDMIFEGTRPPAQLDALKELHKLILDTSE